MSEEFYINFTRNILKSKKRTNFMTNLKIFFANTYKKINYMWASLKNDSRFLTFVIFASLLFVKLFYFQFSIEQPTKPQSFSLFFLPKITISLFLSSILFVTKKKWWTILLSFAIDLWAIGNIIYYRASGFFINVEALQMIDNMRGFWDSILIYFSWRELIPVLTTLIYTFFIIRFKTPKANRRWSLFFLALLLCICMRMFVNFFQHTFIAKDYWIRKEKTNIETVWNTVRPIIDPHYEAYYAARLYFTHGTFVDWEKGYILQNTIIDYLFAGISYYIYKKQFTQKLTILRHGETIGSSDKEIIDKLLSSPNTPAQQVKTNLVVILFESLEGWIFEEYEGSEHIVPNLKRLIKKENILFVPRLKSQTLQGNSGDGQMITLTGILPLKVGAACRLYGNNSYPNYAHFFKSSITINPAPGAWNQRTVNPNYGMTQLIEMHGNDDQMIDTLIAQGNNAEQPFFLLGITTASHSPFNCEDFFNKPDLSNDMPATLQNYLTCVNYTDKALGKLISLIETDPKWANTTLVIVGDHTVFKETMLNKFSNYAQKADISLKTKRNYIPLIIYSPQITSKILKKDIYYQSDVYPTILNLIGEKDYYWKGVGQDILSEDDSNRLNEETGYRISDIIIRNNYFEKYPK